MKGLSIRHPIQHTALTAIGDWSQSLRDAIVGLAFPQMCALCGASIESLDDGVTCHQCWDAMPRLASEHRCDQCGMPIRAQWTSRQSPIRCTQCCDLMVTLLRFVGPYQGALRENILFLKHYPHVCRRLRAMIRQTFQQETSLHVATKVAAVPLHPLRRKERGFNQADIIARIIARAAQIPFDGRVVARIKHTERHRAGLDAQARARSVTAAFMVQHPERVREQIILLVDDVFTTGATINECSQVLLQAGAKAVYGFTLARVLPDAALSMDAGMMGGAVEPGLDVRAGRP